MSTASRKSTVQEIKQRFDNDVERFSSLQTGHVASMDSLLLLDLVPSIAAALKPDATSLLDIGCGAGNYSLKFLEHRPTLQRVTLIDLSRPMLDRAAQRLASAGVTELTPIQADIREADLPESGHDVVIAAAVLHHLRSRQEWADVLGRVYRTLKPGGVLAVADMISHENPRVQQVMTDRYADYLRSVGGEEYQRKVFAYIQQEDTPWPLTDQLDLVREAGFRQVEVLHKNGLFSAYSCIRP